MLWMNDSKHCSWNYEMLWLTWRLLLSSPCLSSFRRHLTQICMCFWHEPRNSLKLIFWESTGCEVVKGCMHRLFKEHILSFWGSIVLHHFIGIISSVNIFSVKNLIQSWPIWPGSGLISYNPNQVQLCHNYRKESIEIQTTDVVVETSTLFCWSVESSFSACSVLLPKMGKA